jgi:hypothetical protein
MMCCLCNDREAGRFDTGAPLCLRCRNGVHEKSEAARAEPSKPVVVRSRPLDPLVDFGSRLALGLVKNG